MSNPFTFEELAATIDGVYGLRMCIADSTRQLQLSSIQVAIFCRNTPGGAKGEALWNTFKARRDAPNAQKDYDFGQFMKEVMAEAGHPIS